MREYDVVIVGAGIAGLSAATYAAADGMSVAVVEAKQVGGQVRHSPRLDNVVGLAGVRGDDLVYNAAQQAVGFGAEFIDDAVAAIVPHRSEDDNALVFDVQLDSGFTLLGRTVVLATGCRFRKVTGRNMDILEGKAVFYGEAHLRAPEYVGKDVGVIGGGNASAQSVLYLSHFAKTVNVFMRSHETWSEYLAREIAKRRNIHLWPYTKVEGALRTPDGDGMAGVTVLCNTRQSIPLDALFVLAGQVPNAELATELGLQTSAQREGRIRTGALFVDWHDSAAGFIARDPLPLETNIPGIFAIGDVRDGPGHGVAAAMGDGGTVVTELWEYFATHHKPTFLARLTGEQPPSLRLAAPSPA